jgi:Tfp pilus assembly protein PilE
VSTSTIVWIIVIAVVALLIIAVIAAMMSKNRASSRRSQAADLRNQAAEQETKLQQQDARAQETSAHARQARAEADMRAAQAAQLEVQARDQQGVAQSLRQERDDRLSRADELDPDTDPASAGDASTGRLESHPSGPDTQPVEGTVEGAPEESSSRYDEGESGRSG